MQYREKKFGRVEPILPKWRTFAHHLTKKAAKMAVVKPSAVGTMRKSIGGITFSDWKSIPTARQKPTVVANPNTPAQQSQRTKFGVLGELGRRMLATVKTGFRNKAIKMSEINVFMKLNIPDVTYVGGVATVNLVTLRVSQGSVGIPGAATVTAGVAPGAVGLAISDNTDGVVALASDLLYVGVYNPTDNTSTLVNTGKTRATAGVAFQLATGAANEGDNIHLYPFFKRATSSETSDNTHIAVTP